MTPAISQETADCILGAAIREARAALPPLACLTLWCNADQSSARVHLWSGDPRDFMSSDPDPACAVRRVMRLVTGQ